MEASVFTIPFSARDAVSSPRGPSYVSARWYAAASPAANATLVLAHGAGAPQTHPWMVSAATALAARGLDIVTFNFPYADAGRRLPDRAPVLEACWLAVIGAVGGRRHLPAALLIGGKSMGGRMATHVAARPDAASRINGLVLLGYPLCPPSRPGQRRDRHIAAIDVPMLFVQGTRDPFGTIADWHAVTQRLGARATLVSVEGGDHSLLVPRRWPRSREEALGEAWDAVARWVRARVR